MSSIEDAARRLRAAHDQRVPTGPVRDAMADAIESLGEVAAGYAVQAINDEAAVASGRRRSGYKIGLTNPMGQQFFGVDEPTFGVLYDDARVAAGEVVACERLMQPRLEGEVAIALGADLDGDHHDLDGVAAAVDHVVAAIEIVDCRVDDWKITAVDMIADNMASGLYVLGDHPMSLDEIGGLADIPMTMSVDGEQRSAGIGAGCLGNPLNAVMWLANEMAKRGTPLRAGAHIMSGALGPIIPMPHTSTITADFGPLGSVSTSWAARDA